MIFSVQAKWPWRYRSRSRVITCDTQAHAIDHLYQIWKESILNCSCYRADTGCGTDGRTDGRMDGRTDGQTDGRTEWNQYTPNNFVVWGYNETNIPPNSFVVAWLVPSHYLNRCWNIINLTLGNKLQWNLNGNLCIVTQENAFENVVWKLMAILSQPRCVISN